MSNYTKATNFATKDSLATGNPGKIVKGTEIDTEFNAISTAIATKADAASPTLTGVPTCPTADAGTNTTQIANTAFVNTALASVGTTGRILQMKQKIFSSSYDVNTSSWVSVGHSESITPSSTSSKILILVLGGDNWNKNNTGPNNRATIYRNSTNLGGSDGLQNFEGMYFGQDQAFDWSNSMAYLDSPATTSSTTYAVYAKGNYYYNQPYYACHAVMILMEIL